MEIDTSLLPTHLRLCKKILQSMTRMQTVQENHPIYQTIKRAMNSRSGRHISTLEYLTRSFPELVKPLEVIKPYARPPWWTPPPLKPKQPSTRKSQNKLTTKHSTTGATHSASIQMAQGSTDMWEQPPL